MKNISYLLMRVHGNGSVTSASDSVAVENGLTGAELDRIAAAGGDPSLGSGPSRGGNLLSHAELDRVSAAGGSGSGGFGSGGGGSGNN
jgi:hypothetical protein